MRFLVDECLHTSLLQVAHAVGHEADHVIYRGLGGRNDREILRYALKHDFVFVTNNDLDFRRLYRRESLHPGLIILVPQVEPAVQRALFGAALAEIGEDEPVNGVIEVTLRAGRAVVSRFPFPGM